MCLGPLKHLSFSFDVLSADLALELARPCRLVDDGEDAGLIAEITCGLSGGSGGRQCDNNTIVRFGEIVMVVWQ
jgi:hypothetical protein